MYCNLVNNTIEIVFEKDIVANIYIQSALHFLSTITYRTQNHMDACLDNTVKGHWLTQKETFGKLGTSAIYYLRKNDDIIFNVVGQAKSYQIPVCDVLFKLMPCIGTLSMSFDIVYEQKFDAAYCIDSCDNTVPLSIRQLEYLVKTAGECVNVNYIERGFSARCKDNILVLNYYQSSSCTVPYDLFCCKAAYVLLQRALSGLCSQYLKVNYVDLDSQMQMLRIPTWDIIMDSGFCTNVLQKTDGVICRCLNEKGYTHKIYAWSCDNTFYIAKDSPFAVYSSTPVTVVTTLLVDYIQNHVMPRMIAKCAKGEGSISLNKDTGDMHFVSGSCITLKKSVLKIIQSTAKLVKDGILSDASRDFNLNEYSSILTVYINNIYTTVRVSNNLLMYGCIPTADIIGGVITQ